MNKQKIIGALVVLGLILLPISAAVSQEFCLGNFDYDKDVDGTDAFSFKTHFGRGQFFNPCPPDGPAEVEKTGQTITYLSCDDGNLESGVAWPNQRFTDNLDGTVTDNLTGLIWLKDANCSDAQADTWAQAVENAHYLHGTCGGTIPGGCGLSDASCGGDWRLPNARELHSLVDFSKIDPVLPQGHPFINVQSGIYWSSTTGPYLGGIGAWTLDMYGGTLTGNNKVNKYYVWPVRGGSGGNSLCAMPPHDCQMGVNCIEPAECCVNSVGACYCYTEGVFTCGDEFATPVQYCDEQWDCEMGVNCIEPAECCVNSVGACYCYTEGVFTCGDEFATPVEQCNNP